MVALIASILLLTTPPKVGFTGTWKGESLCTVRPSACHDEVVIYDVTEEKKSKLHWKASKIVEGEEKWMGTLECDYQASNQVALCSIPNGKWEFHADGDNMTGTL